MKTALTLIAFGICALTYAQSTVSGTISHTSGTRSYQLYVPAAYTGTTSVPLVLNLHGYGSNNTQQMSYGTFNAIADTANFLILAPQGTNDGTGTSHWNAAWGTGVDDVGFLSALIDSISASYNVNQDRIYSTGMSNGGFMSFTLAGELSDKIAAVASVTGTMSVLQIPNNTVTRPMPIMQIHGTSDPTVNYNGDAYFLSVDSVINYWVGFNNCNSAPVFTAITNSNTTDGCTAEKYEYLGGDNGAEVVHYKVIGGAHTWPGAPFTIGVTNRDFNASVEIWKFFSKYEKSSLVGMRENESSLASLFSIGQNPVTEVLNLNASSDQLYSTKLFGLDGRLLRESTNLRGSSRVDMIYLPVGLYVLNVTTPTGSISFKIVKE